MNGKLEGFRVTILDGVATLTFCRPELGNAISPEMVAPLTTFFSELSATPGVRCLVLRGEGKHFSTGGDVAGFGAMLNEGTDVLQSAFGERLTATATLVEALLSVEQPVIAIVRGGVAGAGLMFILGADIVLADESAMFLFSHQRIGLPPDGGVSWLLPRIVGRRAAAHLVLTAARVRGPEALSLGLISQLVSADGLDAESERLAKQMASAPRHAVRHAKKLLRASEAATPGDQLAAERAAIVACVGEADFAEGVRAFMEKRSAVFPSAAD